MWLQVVFPNPEGEAGEAKPHGIRGTAVERMLCTECAAESYSAAAKTLVEQGDRCPVCGGELMLEPRERVPVPAEMRSGEQPAAPRRFERD